MNRFIIITVVVIILYYLYSNNYFSKEHFVLVAYNNTEVPKYELNSSFDIQNKIFIKSFEKFKLNKNYDDKDISTIGELYNKNINFPFTEAFKKIIIEYLINQNIFDKADQIYIIDNLYNIFTLDIQNQQIDSRYFQFIVTVADQKTFLSKQLKVKLKVNNINQFLSDPIDENLLNKNTEIVYIDVDKPSVLDYPIESIDALNTNFYEIKNKYHLMDPFLTSGADQTITDDLRKKFKNVLYIKSKAKDTEYHDYKI